MDLLTKTAEGKGQVTVDGRFDAYAAPEVAATLETMMDEGISDIWLDMSETTFIDSTALAELVRFMKRARTAGGDLTLWKPSDAVRVILELTSLDLAFSISQAEASPVERRTW